jgi:O-antigen ligase
MMRRRGSMRPSWFVTLLVMIAAGLLACGVAVAQDLPGGPDAPVIPAGPDTPPPDIPPTQQPQAPPPTSQPDNPPPVFRPDPPPDTGPTPAELEAQRQAQLAAQRAAAAARAAAQRRREAEQRVGNFVQEQVLASTSELADALEVAIPPPVFRVSKNKEAVMVVLGLLLWTAVVAGFAALERRGRTIHVISAILFLIVIDATLYSTANDINGGIFNPGAGGFSISLVDAMIVAALIARLLTGKLFKLTTGGVWWLAFIGWILASGVAGALIGHKPSIIMFEGRVVLYILLLLLATSVPIQEYLKPRNLALMLVPACLASLFLLATSISSWSTSVHAPGLDIPSLGTMGADGASIFSGLGLIALSLAFTAERGRLWLLLAAGPLLTTPLFATQRAVLIGATLSLLLVLGTWLVSPTGRRRRRLTGAEGVVAGLCVIGVIVTSAVVVSAANPTEPRIPGVEQIHNTFEGRGKASSAESRVSQWSEASALIKDKPVFGHGLGVEYTFYSPGADVELVSKSTHNIGMDMLLRTGVVGLLAFMAALLLTFREGFRSWWDHNNDMVAALALASAGVLVALFSKGMVESMLEKYRLMTFFGITIGIAGSAFLSRSTTVSQRAVQKARILASAPARVSSRRPRASRV